MFADTCKFKSVKNEKKKPVKERVEELYMLLVREFVCFPKSLNIRVEQANGKVALAVKPDQEDAGRLIGGKGAMFQSVIAVMSHFTRRLNHEFHYKVDDHEDPICREPNEIHQEHPQAEAHVNLSLERICEKLFQYPAAIETKGNNGKMNIYLKLDSREPHHVTDIELQDGLSRIFNAIGKVNGRQIYVDGLERK